MSEWIKVDPEKLPSAQVIGWTEAGTIVHGCLVLAGPEDSKRVVTWNQDLEVRYYMPSPEPPEGWDDEQLSKDWEDPSLTPVERCAMTLASLRRH